MLHALSNRAEDRPAASTRLRLASASAALLALLVLAPAGARAAVVVDNTLGTAGVITGPAYVVDQSDGAIAGDILYLSFETLAVALNETLTINGPANIQHVVVRVTGAVAAQIDGAVTLGIAGASLVIASPAGLNVSQEGVFTVDGGLILTTADYVRASSGDRFTVPPLASEELPDTAPAHLGFLAGPLGVLTVADTSITVPGVLRLVAGNVAVTDTTLEANDIAVLGATAGELALGTLNVSSMSGMGSVTLTRTTLTAEVDTLVYPEGCGNGWVDAGEECDDGDAISASTPDACRPGCEDPSCGDGVRDSDEDCDAGVMNSDTAADGCRTNCRAARCGDGVQDTGEICDDGAMNSDMEEGACLTDCTYAVCGDGVRASVEECDEGAGNSDTAADACRTDCTVAACGDSVVDGDEECDDGPNNSDGTADACRDDCTLATCGDRVVDTGEVCDDGPFNSDEEPERCRLDCGSVNGPLDLIGGACDVPRRPGGEWPLGAFVLAAVALLVPLRRRRP